MRRVTLLSLLALLALYFQLIISCAESLDNGNGPDPSPPIPVYIVDTLYEIDTLMITDSTNTTDTLYVIDTTMVFDTVFVTDTVDIGDTIEVTDTLEIIDTLYQFDTVIIVDSNNIADTLYVIDTTLVFDTVFVTDTITVTDTIVVIEPDSTGAFTECSQLSSYQQEVVWLFPNDSGQFRIEILSAMDSDKPKRTLIIEIGDEQIEWRPGDEPELELIRDLSRHAMIKIGPDKPSSFGHTINICVRLSRS
jgi:hypothetical protein